MLRIQKHQELELTKLTMRSFEDRMVDHIKKFFPEHFTALEDEKTRALIQFGISQAATYDIISERDVCIYIDLMIALGPEFDTDPKTTWAADILNDEALVDPGDKVDVLHDEAMRQLKSSPEWRE